MLVGGLQLTSSPGYQSGPTSLPWDKLGPEVGAWEPRLLAQAWYIVGNPGVGLGQAGRGRNDAKMPSQRVDSQLELLPTRS